MNVINSPECRQKSTGKVEKVFVAGWPVCVYNLGLKRESSHFGELLARNQRVTCAWSKIHKNKLM